MYFLSLCEKKNTERGEDTRRSVVSESYERELRKHSGVMMEEEKVSDQESS